MPKFKLIRSVLSGNTWLPALMVHPDHILNPEALTMATAGLGRQGVGKSIFWADYLTRLALEHPDWPMYFFDWSGPFRKAFYRVILSDPKRMPILDKTIHDQPGHPRWVVPMPLLHRAFDPEASWQTRVERQVSRIVQDFADINYDLVTQNPTMGGIPIFHMLPNVGRLLSAIPSGADGNWQITDAKRLLRGHENTAKQKKKGEVNELWAALEKFGDRVPRAKDYFEHEYGFASQSEKEKRTMALRNVLNVVEAPDLRARFGSDHPAWMPADVYEKGLKVMFDTSDLIGREMEQLLVNKTTLSLIMADIKKRSPDDPNLKPTILFYDDAYGFFNRPPISTIIAEMPSQYRTRKLCLILSFQSLKQLSGGLPGQRGLKENFWSIGNILVWALHDIEDCLEVSTQLVPFRPRQVKVPAHMPTQHDIMANRDEQAAIRAYGIQHLKKREFYIRRYLSEDKMDSRIRHYLTTPEVKLTAPDSEIEDTVESLLKAIGEDIEKALQAVDSRKLPDDDSALQEPQSLRG